MDKDQESVASLSTAAAEAEEDRKSKDTEEQETADDVGNENLTQETLSQQLLKAARIGDANMVEQLIEKGANIHATDQDGATALMWAAKAWGGADVVQKLIENGANIHATDKDGATALISGMTQVWCKNLLRQGQIYMRQTMTGIQLCSRRYTWHNQLR